MDGWMDGIISSRWDRLEELLQVAATSEDYDVALAIDQLLDYVLSDQGTTTSYYYYYYYYYYHHHDEYHH